MMTVFTRWHNHNQVCLVYTIILPKSVCRSSQFVLDRHGRCLKLFVSTVGPSSHEFASQFGLAYFFSRKNAKKLGLSSVTKAADLPKIDR